VKYANLIKKEGGILEELKSIEAEDEFQEELPELTKYAQWTVKNVAKFSGFHNVQVKVEPEIVEPPNLTLYLRPRPN